MPSDDDLAAYAQHGAVIIDVRTPEEFSSGHGKNSKNIPLDKIGKETSKIKALNKPVIVCCRSGARSGQAAGILKSAGVDVINGGSWQNVANL